MNIFNVKWGIHICISITRATKYFLRNSVFQFSSGELFRKALAITLTPHVYQIIFSSNLDDSQYSDLNNFEKRRNQQICESLACLKMSLNNQKLENLFYEYLAFNT